jgi:hypothetical protein
MDGHYYKAGEITISEKPMPKHFTPMDGSAANTSAKAEAIDMVQKNLEILRTQKNPRPAIKTKIIEYEKKLEALGVKVIPSKEEVPSTKGGE